MARAPGSGPRKKKDPYAKFDLDDVPYALHPDQLPENPEIKTIFIVEGEKTADHFNEVIELTGSTTVVAATLQNGKNRMELWEGFLQRYPNMAEKRIRIFPDNNESGKKLAKMVAATIVYATKSANVRIVPLPGLPEGGNFVDWFTDFKEKNKKIIDDKKLATLAMEEIVKFCKQAEAITPEIVASWQL